MKVLNSSYGPSDISFNLVNKSYTKNELWSKGFDNDDLEVST